MKLNKLFKSTSYILIQVFFYSNLCLAEESMVLYKYDEKQILSPALHLSPELMINVITSENKLGLYIKRAEIKSKINAVFESFYNLFLEDEAGYYKIYMGIRRMIYQKQLKEQEVLNNIRELAVKENNSQKKRLYLMVWAKLEEDRITNNIDIRRPYYKAEYITLSLTRRCNAQCEICYSESGPYHKEKLSVEQIKIILEQAKQMGIKEVRFQGGELSYARDEFIAAVKIAKELGIEPSGFNTNAGWIGAPWAEDFLLQLRDAYQDQYSWDWVNKYWKNSFEKELKECFIQAGLSLANSQGLAIETVAEIKQRYNFEKDKVNFHPLPAWILTAKDQGFLTDIEDMYHIYCSPLGHRLAWAGEFWQQLQKKYKNEIPDWLKNEPWVQEALKGIEVLRKQGQPEIMISVDRIHQKYVPLKTVKQFVNKFFELFPQATLYVHSFLNTQGDELADFVDLLRNEIIEDSRIINDPRGSILKFRDVKLNNGTLKCVYEDLVELGRAKNLPEELSKRYQTKKSFNENIGWHALFGKQYNFLSRYDQGRSFLAHDIRTRYIEISDNSSFGGYTTIEAYAVNSFAVRWDGEFFVRDMYLAENVFSLGNISEKSVEEAYYYANNNPVIHILNTPNGHAQIYRIAEDFNPGLDQELANFHVMEELIVKILRNPIDRLAITCKLLQKFQKENYGNTQSIENVEVDYEFVYWINQENKMLATQKGYGTKYKPNELRQADEYVSLIRTYLKAHQKEIWDIVRINLEKVDTFERVRKNQICSDFSYILARVLSDKFNCGFGDKKNTSFVIEGGLKDNGIHFWVTFYCRGKPVLFIDPTYAQFDSRFNDKILVESYHNLSKYGFCLFKEYVYDKYKNNIALLKETIKQVKKDFNRYDAAVNFVDAGYNNDSISTSEYFVTWLLRVEYLSQGPLYKFQDIFEKTHKVWEPIVSKLNNALPNPILNSKIESRFFLKKQSLDRVQQLVEIAI
ncbi:MAG: radical SAM protein [Candidatus Omnitrophota bacterium]